MYQIRSSKFGQDSLEEGELAHFTTVNDNYAIRHATVKDRIFGTVGAAELYWLHEGFSPVNSWKDMEQALLKKGGKYILNKDIDADSRSSYFGIPKGVSATVDLNGYTIDSRDLKESYVFVVDGSLTLMDSRGSGGINFYDSQTGGVKVQGGDFVMSGGHLESWGAKRAVVVSGGLTIGILSFSSIPS